MASYDLKAILGEKLKRLTDKMLKALVDCMCTVGASLCSLDKRVSALESVELPEGGYKPMQEPVSSPSANGTAIQFIESVSQDATGRMTATKKTVRSASGSQSGVMSPAHYTKLNALYSKDELDDLFDGKANKGEMSITPGTGTDADKTTIQLKSGASATVLTSHQDVSQKTAKNVTFARCCAGITSSTIASTTKRIALSQACDYGSGSLYSIYFENGNSVNPSQVELWFWIYPGSDTSGNNPDLKIRVYGSEVSRIEAGKTYLFERRDATSGLHLVGEVSSTIDFMA